MRLCVRKTLPLMMVALLIMSLPALADLIIISQPFDKIDQMIHLGANTPEVGGSIGASTAETLVFEQRDASPYFFRVPNTTFERANTLNLKPGDYISRLVIGFATDSTVPVRLSVAFYDSDQEEPPQQRVLKTRQGTKAVYEVTFSDVLDDGLNRGYEVEINLGENGFFVPPGGKMTIGTVYTDAGNASLNYMGYPCIGPILAGPGPGPAPGSQDFWYQFDPASWRGGGYKGAYWFGGAPPSTFWCAVWSSPPPREEISVPTLSQPGLIFLLLSLVGIAVLALRRKSSAFRS